MSFRACDGAVDPTVLRAAVQDSSCGAVVLFVGRVRDATAGRRVLRLEYQMYEEMAIPLVERLMAEESAGLEAARAAAAHATGVLEPGQAAFGVAVACPHRAEAFDLCRRIVDRIKHEAPIWKREVFEDGAQWVEGCAD